MALKASPMTLQTPSITPKTSRVMSEVRTVIPASMADDTWRIIDDVNYIIGDTRDIIVGGQNIICGTQDITRRTRRIIDGAGSATDDVWTAIDRRTGITDAGWSVTRGLASISNGGNLPKLRGRSGAEQLPCM